MKVLIDTNVVLDVLCDRKPFTEDSADVLKLCEVKKLAGYLCALSAADLVYILRRELDEKKVRDLMDKLTRIFTVADLKAGDLTKAAALGFSDFEDAVQCACAKRLKADFIVTRNVRDYAKSPVPAVTPTELLRSL